MPRVFKGLWFVGILGAVGCLAGPDQHNEAKYKTYTVAFGPSLDADARPWAPAELAELEKETRVLWALGPTVLIVGEGEAQFVLRPFVADTPVGHCAAGSGRFHPGSAYAECDPACTDGFGGLRQCYGHEFGHWTGMLHICRPGETGADCSSVGQGDGMMNRRIDYPTAQYGDLVSHDIPTVLDLAEFRRTHP